MISKLRNGCEITSKLRNDLQIAKLTCKIEEGLQKHLAKPREVVKMPIEPRAPWDHTHQASHSISDLLKPSEPKAPAEETMPSKETTRTEVKVLIQPTQEAITDTSAPQDPTTT